MCIKRVSGVLIILTMFFGNVLAQTSTADSLKKLVVQKKAGKSVFEDTELVKLQTGIAYAYSFNNPDSTFFYCRQALALSAKLHYQKGYYISLRMMSIGFYDQGNYIQAFKYLDESLSLSEKAGDDEQTLACVFDLINIYFTERDYRQVNKYIDKAWVIYNRCKQAALLTEILSARSQMYVMQNKLGLALADLNNILVICKSTKAFGAPAFDTRDHTVAFTSNDIGNIYVKQGDYQKAIGFFNNALNYFKRVNDEIGLVDTYGFLANVYFKNKNYNTALWYGMKSYKLCKGKKLLRPLKDISAILYPIYQAKGQYKDAFSFFNLYKIYSDSIFNETKIKEIDRLEAKAEFDKQQIKAHLAQTEKDAKNQKMLSAQTRVIFITLSALILSLLFTVLVYISRQQKLKINGELVQKNQEIKNQADELENQANELATINQVKNKLFSIIAHDLRSPLVSFIQMLQLVEDETVDANDFRAMVPQLLENVSYTSMMLENLLMWSLSQLNGFTIKKEQFDLNTLVTNNIRIFERQISEKYLGVENLVDDYLMVNTDKNTIDLTLRNLIANAIKFTPNNGKISISANIHDHDVDVTVADTGTGLSHDDAAKLFSDEIKSKDGTANEKGTGLGLKICKEFIERIGGKIWVSSQIGKGSTFSFSIPV